MKRLHDCGLWKCEWFRKLPSKQKLLLTYLWDNCDLTGVWEADFGLATFQIGEEGTPADIVALNEAMEETRIVRITAQKFWISDFVSFQYGRIGDQSKVHVSVFKRLVEHGLETQDCIPYASEEAFLRLSQAFTKSRASPKDKRKDISKESEKVHEEGEDVPEVFRDPRKKFSVIRGRGV
jgi:hypothetical protein